jgi:hypothetical protein
MSRELATHDIVEGVDGADILFRLGLHRCRSGIKLELTNSLGGVLENARRVGSGDRCHFEVTDSSVALDISTGT